MVAITGVQATERKAHKVGETDDSSNSDTIRKGAANNERQVNGMREPQAQEGRAVGKADDSSGVQTGANTTQQPTEDNRVVTE